MQVSGVISAILIGALVGVLGRLVLPGKQPIGFIFTILIGIGAAFAGTWVATLLDVEDTKGIDWIELALQVGLAAVGVGIVSAVMSPRRTRTRRR